MGSVRRLLFVTAAVWVLMWPGTLCAQTDCAFDDHLSAAAAALLSEGRAPDAAGLRRALGEAGSDVVGAHALFVPMTDGAEPGSDRDPVSGWLSRLTARAAAPLVCGEAQGEAGSMWLAAVRAGGLSVSRAGAIPVVTGWLAPAFADATLVLVDADGDLSRRHVSGEELERGVVLSAELGQPARVQLVATGPYGPQPVAERSIAWPDGVPAGGVAADVAMGGGVSGRVNALRRRRGVGEVRRHGLLRRLAARHAHRVCRQGRVAHSLSPGGDPEARLRAAGVEAQRIGEAVARADDPSAAFSALLRSPSHLLTLVESSFTDAGVGVAEDPQGRACLVVLLARWPRYVGR